eukprot:365596-Chlamydomonas_euryale.AAC.28
MPGVPSLPRGHPKCALVLYKWAGQRYKPQHSDFITFVPALLCFRSPASAGNLAKSGPVYGNAPMYGFLMACHTTTMQ